MSMANNTIGINNGGNMLGKSELLWCDRLMLIPASTAGNNTKKQTNDYESMHWGTKV